MIQRLNKKHYNEIMEPWLESTVTAHPFIEKSYWEEKYHEVRNKYLPKAITYVYIKNDIIKGFISIIDENYIGALFVRTEFQYNMIGSQLLSYVKNLYSNLELAVYTDNIQALNFYIKHNFEITNERLDSENGFLESMMQWSK